jgi:hypothetical protein
MSARRRDWMRGVLAAVVDGDDGAVAVELGFVPAAARQSARQRKLVDCRSQHRLDGKGQHNVKYPAC